MDLVLEIRPNHGQEGEGVQNPENSADILNGWPLTGSCGRKHLREIIINAQRLSQ